MARGPHIAAGMEAKPATVPLELRPYQRACIEKCLKELGNGVWRQAVSLPVGSGKTVIFSNLIQRMPAPTPEATKTLVLAHREELLVQAAQQIKRASPHLEVHIDQARRVASPAADVVVASVATLGRKDSARIRRHDPARFKCIIIDEAHHAAAESYARILEYFGQCGGGAEHRMLVWGCSATLFRHDGLALKDVFDEIVFEKSFLEMIREEWLAKLRVTTVRTSCSLDGVRTQAGDFSVSQLSSKVNSEERNKAVVVAHATLAKDRRSTVVFAVDIAHAEALRDTFESHGTRAEVIVSTTRADARVRILDEFRAGKLPVVVNCGILTEGTDIPVIDCVMLARPTRSSVLFQQMLGRGMRLSPGKEDCLAIDFVDAFKRSIMQITIPTLLGLSPSALFNKADVLDIATGKVGDIPEHPVDEIHLTPEEKLILKFDKYIADSSPTDGITTLAQIGFKAQVHLNPLRFFEIGSQSQGTLATDHHAQLERMSCGAAWGLRSISSLAWLCLEPDRFMVSVRDIKVYVHRNTDTGRWSAGIRRPIGKAKYHSKSTFYTSVSRLDMDAISLEQAVRGIETMLKSVVPMNSLKLARWDAPWRGQPPTEAQIKNLRRMGFALPDDADKWTDPEVHRKGAKITRGAAANLIDCAMNGGLRAWKDYEVAKARVAKSEGDKLAEVLKNALWISPTSDARQHSRDSDPPSRDSDPPSSDARPATPVAS
ncbi:DEAD DEAH box helicase [Coemansia biformis]|uniref:DEAD DEAH box helicase n=1 Tax=Coemansia biformis TaxID=1286918 RepID=A0A9W7YBS7_9FUNG|nr:DEAD DEAH box helicase [Coemansia biformis]